MLFTVRSENSPGPPEHTSRTDHSSSDPFGLWDHRSGNLCHCTITKATTGPPTTGAHWTYRRLEVAVSQVTSVVEHELKRRLARKLRPLDVVDVVHVDRRELAGVRTFERNAALREPQLTIVLKRQICRVSETQTGGWHLPEARGFHSERRKTATSRPTLF